MRDYPDWKPAQRPADDIVQPISDTKAHTARFTLVVYTGLSLLALYGAYKVIATAREGTAVDHILQKAPGVSQTQKAPKKPGGLKFFFAPKPAQ